MFSVEEFVIHPTGGICKVTAIGPLDIQGADSNRQYYFLIPLKGRGSKVFVPVDMADDVIRRVMTDEEAWKLIDEIPSIDEMRVESEKMRENCYKEAIKSCDLRRLVMVMKNLNTRRCERQSQGKKNTATDEKYLRIAEENLYNELAFAVRREREYVEAIIWEKMDIADGR